MYECQTYALRKGISVVYVFLICHYGIKSCLLSQSILTSSRVYKKSFDRGENWKSQKIVYIGDGIELPSNPHWRLS